MSATCPPRGHSRFKISWYSPAHRGQDWRFVVARNRAAALRKFARKFGAVAPGQVQIKNAGKECW